MNLENVADLTAEGVLPAHGIDRLDPTRRHWPDLQPVGHAYYRDGATRPRALGGATGWASARGVPAEPNGAGG